MAPLIINIRYARETNYQFHKPTWVVRVIKVDLLIVWEKGCHRCQGLVRLSFQDSRMDSIIPQIPLQAICYLFLKALPFLVCFRERPPEMRYGMYLVDVVAQPFFKRL